MPRGTAAGHTHTHIPNAIGDAGEESFAGVLMQCSALTYLHISCNNVTWEACRHTDVVTDVEPTLQRVNHKGKVSFR